MAVLLATPVAWAREDCLLEWRVAGGERLGNAWAADCRDGEAGCDADGAADGGCTAHVILCLVKSGAGGCTAAALDALKLSSDPRLQVLSDALEDLKAVATAGGSEVCTPIVDLPVAKGRLAIMLQRVGKRRTKTLGLVCRTRRRRA